MEVEITSLVQVISNNGPLSTFRGEPGAVLRNVREQCSEQGSSLEEWAALIRDFGRISDTHPFAIFCNQLDLPADHPLRTLGSWAYGFGNPWIVINWVRDDRGTLHDRASLQPRI